MAVLLRGCTRFSWEKRFLKEITCVRRDLWCTISHADVKKVATVLQFARSVSNKSEQNLSTEERVLIYEGPLRYQIRNIKIFSLATSFGGLASQPFLLMKATENDTVVAIVGLFVFVGLFALATPILLHTVTKNYATHLYYVPKKDKYIVRTYSLFVRPKEVEFTPEDVVIPSIEGMFTTCRIKNSKIFFQEDLFKDYKHFVRIMGYDKPIDFKLYDDCNGPPQEDEPKNYESKR